MEVIITRPAPIHAHKEIHQASVQTRRYEGSRERLIDMRKSMRQASPEGQRPTLEPEVIERIV